MHFSKGAVYHIYNRSNHRQPVFFNNENYLFFLRKIRKELLPICDLLCWCLMPTHFHLLIHANDASCAEHQYPNKRPVQALAAAIGTLLSSYTQATNKQRSTHGSLFQSKTKAKPVSEMMQEAVFSGNLQHYLIRLVHYIHQNPKRAGLVTKLEDWPFSSFSDYAGIRSGTLCQKELLLLLTGLDPVTFYQDSYAIL